MPGRIPKYRVRERPKHCYVCASNPQSHSPKNTDPGSLFNLLQDCDCDGIFILFICLFFLVGFHTSLCSMFSLDSVLTPGGAQEIILKDKNLCLTK